MKRRTSLKRRTALVRTASLRPSRSTRKPRSGFTPASRAQRLKTSGLPCLVCGQEVDVDPAHLAARAQGGCDSPDCVVELCRYRCHRPFDDGELDLLPYLLAGRRVVELQHALGHYKGDLVGLLHRLTGQRWTPAREAA